MKLFLLLLLPVIFFACGSEYGKKVTVNNNSDVFYTGEGVTEDDAKRLGDFLLREGYFDTVTNKTVQLTKDSASWVVRLVVDKEKYANVDATILTSMRILEAVMSEQVFNRQRTRLELVDDEMKPVDTSSPAQKMDSLSKENTDSLSKE